jgi:hypothetical protein
MHVFVTGATGFIGTERNNLVPARNAPAQGLRALISAT